MIASHHVLAAIRFVPVIASSRSPFSADCTMSIVSSRWPHEPTDVGRKFCGRHQAAVPDLLL